MIQNNYLEEMLVYRLHADTNNVYKVTMKRISENEVEVICQSGEQKNIFCVTKDSVYDKKGSLSKFITEPLRKKIFFDAGVVRTFKLSKVRQDNRRKLML